MSVSYVPEAVKIRLWGKAAGRCEYAGCNDPLWKDTLTQAEFNVAYLAHIVADSPDGPRGDTVLSAKLKADISNLMLLCDRHHRLVDVGEVASHPRERLLEMKDQHEKRVEVATGIHVERQTTVVLYGANVGTNTSPVNNESAVQALFPARYPSSRSPIVMGLKGSEAVDHEAAFWEQEAENLERQIERNIRPGLVAADLRHLSVFAVAPQPLLTLLGSLLTDIPEAEIFQLRREPRTWRWDENETATTFKITEPEPGEGVPALVLSLSATINRSRIVDAIGPEASIWEVTIGAPSNDFLKSRAQLAEFRRVMRDLYNRIKARYGEKQPLHIFPAVPVAIAVEIGRVRMPKADLPIILYDSKDGVFRKALELPRPRRRQEALPG